MIHKVVAVAALILGLSLVVATPAVATAAAPTVSPVWTTTLAPSPTVAGGSLSAVSCPSTSFCVAVGSYQAPDTYGRPLILIGDGSTWHTVAAPLPTAARTVRLLAVSCRSRSFCMAAGYYNRSNFDELTQMRPLSERWDGTSWHVLKARQPSNSWNSMFKGVSCPRVNLCFAVGEEESYTGPQYPMAQRWNGSTWSLVKLPNPKGLRGFDLNGISCPGASSCVAVGGSSDDKFARPMAEHWNGTRWTARTPSSAGVRTDVTLTAVSCTSPRNCSAVGNAAPWTIGTSWNGSRWTTRRIVPTSHPTWRQTQAFAISCSGGRCTAFGYYVSGGAWHPMVEHHDGTHWTSTALPSAHDIFPSYALGPFDSVGTYNVPGGIACRGTAFCIAADSAYQGKVSTLTRHWDGAGWHLVTSPDPAGGTGSALNAISCPDVDSCVAVGDGLSDVRSAGQWRLAGLTQRTGRTTPDLTAVHCASTSFCMAVGADSSTVRTSWKPIIERWDGSAWSVSPFSPPTATILYGVSCPGTGFCVAVGTTNGTGLIEQWNGTSWSTVDHPNPSGRVRFSGVSCTSTSFCVAVGYNDTKTVIERWNGTAWSLDTAPAATQAGMLSAVSCGSATSCVAVGSVGATWDGTSWTTIPVPSGIEALSCTAVTCDAVGATGRLYDEVSGQIPAPRAFGATWDGTAWTTSPITAPADELTYEFFGISCTAAEVCHAAGSLSREGTAALLGDLH